MKGSFRKHANGFIVVHDEHANGVSDLRTHSGKLPSSHCSGLCSASPSIVTKRKNGRKNFGWSQEV
jgi:hypothetical protein